MARVGLCCVLGDLEGPLGPGSGKVGQALLLSWSAPHCGGPAESSPVGPRSPQPLLCLSPWTTGFLQLLSSLISLLA